jgi:hypothetical protein
MPNEGSPRRLNATAALDGSWGALPGELPTGICSARSIRHGCQLLREGVVVAAVARYKLGDWLPSWRAMTVRNMSFVPSPIAIKGASR